MIKNHEKVLELGPCISLPYGAAALMNRIHETNGQIDEQNLLEDIVTGLRSCLQQLRIPPDLMRNIEKEGGHRLYLSGGGFRGWGHILMSLDTVQPYPIPMVNGYSVRGADFPRNLQHQSITSVSHRVSKRRGSQVPAVQLIVNAIQQALEPYVVQYAVFCQGLRAQKYWKSLYLLIACICRWSS